MTEAAVRIGLTVEGVDVRFAGTTILGPVSVKVEPGSVVAVLGANGAGKSTLLRAVAGVTPVSSGRIYVGET